MHHSHFYTPGLYSTETVDIFLEEEFQEEEEEEDSPFKDYHL